MDAIAGDLGYKGPKNSYHQHVLGKDICNILLGWDPFEDDAVIFQKLSHAHVTNVQMLGSMRHQH